MKDMNSRNVKAENHQTVFGLVILNTRKMPNNPIYSIARAQ